MLIVQEGNLVQKGDVIGRFLLIEDAAHVHFGLVSKGAWKDPEPFFGRTPTSESRRRSHIGGPEGRHYINPLFLECRDCT